ncbi:hypothetical protein [Sphaerisporangium rufum]|uniref:hypothetical protein n=1 Tax=Sphaerisporangium rufum TaxID=1381558 RepID=UPI0019509A2A|nr:hypothetical protein [Sphaerisporangium rufum]
MTARRDAYTAGRDLHVHLCPVPEPGPAGAGHHRERPIFVQYANPEILACYRVAADTGQTAAQTLRATRLAVLLTDAPLLFPSSYLFELPWFPAYLRAVAPLVHDGLVRHTSAVAEPEAFRELKAREYHGDPVNPYAAPRPPTAAPEPAWHPRPGGPTADDIAGQWRAALVPGGALAGVVRAAARGWGLPYRRAETVLARVPDRLAGRAFVRRFVQAALPGPVPPQVANTVAMFLSAAYLRCYLRELDATIVTDLPAGAFSCALDGPGGGPRDRLLPARRLELALGWLGLAGFVLHGAGWRDLVSLRSSPGFGMITSTLYGNGPPDVFRLAVVGAGRSRPLAPAATCGDALSNVAAVAEELVRLAG